MRTTIHGAPFLLPKIQQIQPATGRQIRQFTGLTESAIATQLSKAWSAGYLDRTQVPSTIGHGDTTVGITGKPPFSYELTQLGEALAFHYGAIDDLLTRHEAA